MKKCTLCLGSGEIIMHKTLQKGSVITSTRRLVDCPLCPKRPKTLRGIMAETLRRGVVTRTDKEATQ